jgi:4-amino-4-deoxy-L-arabinose transferase-like glycosyltransferase
MTRDNCVLAVLTVVGVIVLAAMTQPWGIGLSPDSGVYISAARNLLQGQGLSYIAPGGEMIPMTQWPPLYPILLAMIGFVLKSDPIAATRGLNIALFGANVFLVGHILKKYSRSLWIAALGSFLTLTSFCMLENHSIAQSEPAFYFFGFLGLFLLANHLDQGEKPLFLVASSLAVSLSFLDRYAGISFVATGLAALLFFNREAWPKRLKKGTVFVVVACFPMVLWLIRNVSVANNLWNRRFGFHSLSTENLKESLVTISRWLLPSRVPQLIGDLVALVTVVSLLMIGIGLVWNEMRNRRRQTNSASLAPSTFISLTIMFIFSYSAVLLAHITCFASHFELDDRYLSPLFIAGLLLTLSLADRLWHSLRGKHVFRAALAGGLTLFAGFYLVQGSRWAIETRKEGPWQVTTAWKDSKIMQKVRTLPEGTLIYTNQQHAVQLLTSHSALAIPVKRYVKGDRNYLSELVIMKENLEKSDGVLLYFDGQKIERWYYPTEKELREIMPLRLIEKVAEGANTDGTIYRVKKP